MNNNGLEEIRTPDLRHVNEPHSSNGIQYEPKNLSNIFLDYSKRELDEFLEQRRKGRSIKTQYWIDRAGREFWEKTGGNICWESLNSFRNYVLGRWTSLDAHKKVLGFSNSFLNYLAKIRMDINYRNFGMCLELTRSVKERKMITQRIVIKEDLSNILAYIRKSRDEKLLNEYRYLHYTAFVLFGAYTGQRSMSTISRLTVGQFNGALASNKPVIIVKSCQDKIRMEHYVPIHPNLVDLLTELCKGKSDDNLMFEYHSLWMWLKRQKIPLSHNNNHFTMGDLRKFAEQYGDIIQWEQSNRAYILTHGVSGVDWSHYKHPLPEHVYDNYMKYWGRTKIS